LAIIAEFAIFSSAAMLVLHCGRQAVSFLPQVFQATACARQWNLLTFQSILPRARWYVDRRGPWRLGPSSL